MSTETQTSITEDFITNVVQRIEQGKTVRRKVEHVCKLQMDKKLPFLIVYRVPKNNHDAGILKLVLGENAYLIIEHGTDIDSVRELVKKIGKTLYDTFNGFLLLEIWADYEYNKENPEIVVYGPAKKIKPIVKSFKKAMEPLTHLVPNLKFKSVNEADRAPENQEQIITSKEAFKLGCLVMGMELPAVHFNPITETTYPIFLKHYKHDFSIALRHMIYEFVVLQTTCEILNYRLLASSRLEKIVIEVDKAFADIQKKYQLLMLLSPIHTHKSFQQFKASGYHKKPDLFYRLIPVDPDILKRKLFNIPLEKINDPSLAFIYREKREEIEKQLTMLSERGSSEFLHTSLRLHGGVENSLLETAEGILAIVPSQLSEAKNEISGEEFAKMAKEELDFFKEQNPNIKPKIELRDDLTSLLVEAGTLYVSKKAKLSGNRAKALIQHEVGTHLLTFYNGKEQPLRQLYCGLPGYDELQEGMAVIAEYLSGGLTNNRLRLLAARVIAVKMLTEESTFSETFWTLIERYEFSESAAFDITMRVYRSGGLTKDKVYFRGVLRVLEFIKNGGDYETLLIGKMAESHVPLIEELLERKILKPLSIKPRYLIEEEGKKRYKQLQKGILLTDLIK